MLKNFLEFIEEQYEEFTHSEKWRIRPVAVTQQTDTLRGVRFVVANISKATVEFLADSLKYCSVLFL